MRVYLAGVFETRDVMQAAAKLFQDAGHEITSSWITDPIDNENQTEAAKRDIKDIDNADVFVIKSLPYGTKFIRGGRWFEAGYAYAKGLNIFVVGDFENTFCHLPLVIVCPTFGVVISMMETLG